MRTRGESRAHPFAAVGILLSFLLSNVSLAGSASRTNDRWSYESAIERYVDDVMDRSAARHRELREQLMPDAEVTPAVRRHWSPWREELNRDASRMGCGRALAWMGFAQYLGLAATLSLGFPPYGLAAWLFLPPAALFMSWVGVPRTHRPSAASKPLDLLANDAYEVRRELGFERQVGWKNDPWTAEAFEYFRQIMRARIADRTEALEDSVDQQSSVGFAASPDKIDQWVLDYLELWDLAALYELESRRYAGSWVGQREDWIEEKERERIGQSVDELRTAIVLNSGGHW